MKYSDNLVPFTPEWEFYLKQEEAALSVGLNPDVSDNCSSFSLPDDLIAPVRNLLKLAGTTSLSMYNSNLSIRRQISSRYQYLFSVRDKLQSDAADILNKVAPTLRLTLEEKDTLNILRWNDYTEYQELDYMIRKINKDFADEYANQMKLLHDRYSECEKHVNFLDSVSKYLDITNTINQTVLTGGVDARGKPEKVQTEWRKYLADCPKKYLDIVFGMPTKVNAGYDMIARQLILSQFGQRKAEHIQRLNNETHQRTKDGWYLVFDTLTFSDDGLRSYFNDPKRHNLFRDYVRIVGRAVNSALGLPKDSSYADNYKYYAVYEHGSKNGRFHYHIVHYCKVLPFGARDPLFGVPTDLITEESNHIREWPKFVHGRNFAIACRYTGDPFTRDGWLAPRDANGNIRENKPVDAVIRYVAKYVSKETDRKATLTVETKENERKWQETLKRLDLKKSWEENEFRTRMSRGFGMTLPDMSHLSIDALNELKNLHWTVTPLNMLLKKSVCKEAASRAAILTIQDTQGNLPETINLLKYLRHSIQTKEPFSSPNSGAIATPRLKIQDISNETKDYIRLLAVQREEGRIQVGGRSK